MAKKPVKKTAIKKAQAVKPVAKAVVKKVPAAKPVVKSVPMVSSVAKAAVKKPAVKKSTAKSAPAVKPVVKAAPMAAVNVAPASCSACDCGPKCDCGSKCGCKRSCGFGRFFGKLIVFLIVFALGFTAAKFCCGHDMGRHMGPRMSNVTYVNGCLDLSSVKCPELAEKVTLADVNADGCVTREELRAFKKEMRKDGKGCTKSHGNRPRDNDFGDMND